ncbi:hypothetical protein HCN44_008614 [Aphidius gifuensis]|uniref:MANSC domain-containing protein n=1 Tax=Aphidius gifuensis TaxID=684658 RepID=A0A834XMS9_APHGI|nr:uncharacterized protein LOC122858352 [Aphidius gifuensis]KAF7989940.1 hypothetical protein HCN44_008614 [Aphidius gifuensis]
MLQRVLYISVEFMIILSFVKSERLSENSDFPQMQTDDLRKCMGSFNVHKDKIIRTQDSLALGGEYIADAEISGRQKCVALCCETESCDVFVYEENKPGSCYLFHCGPPHDFKCKFTNHSNYSSAVLMNIRYRKINDLRDYSRRSQQEYELKSLKKKTDLNKKKNAYTEISLSPKVPLETDSNHKTTQTTKNCSRNQYRCQNSGDCIAVYNVCDGIPQCTDGSDEASELGCPLEKSTTLPGIIFAPNVRVPEKSMYPKQTHHEDYLPTYDDAKLKDFQLPIETQAYYPQDSRQYPSQDITTSVVQLKNIRLKNNVGDIDYIQKHNDSNTDEVNNDGSYYKHEELDHTFNRKQPSVNSENTAQKNNKAAEHSWQQNERKPTRSPHHEVIYTTESQYVSIVKENSTTLENRFQALAKPANTKVLTEELASSGSNVSNKKALIEQEKSHSQLEKILKSPIQSDTKDHTLKTLRKKLLNKHKLDESYYQSDDVKYADKNFPKKTSYLQQYSLKPKGAVVSLAVGLTVAAIMVGLIACRLHVVQKRNRRGHNLYAHEADYLVNGMYL